MGFLIDNSELQICKCPPCNIQILIFARQNLVQASKDVQAAGEFFIPQKVLFWDFKTSKHFKTWIFFTFVGHFALLEPDPDPADQNECGSMRIRIHNISYNKNYKISSLIFLLLHMKKDIIMLHTNLIRQLWKRLMDRGRKVHKLCKPCEAKPKEAVTGIFRMVL